MIYSASRRTDLAAGYPDWLAARLERSRKLEAVVYWTKNPSALAGHDGLRRALKRWPAVVQLTVTGLAGSAWEPGVPPLSAWRDALAELARNLPRGAIQWRFDPILLPGSPGPEAAALELVERFVRVYEAVGAALGGVDEVTTSFFLPYRHATARMRAAGLSWRTPGMAERVDLLGRLRQAVGESPMRFRMCCQPDVLGDGAAPEGVEPASCVSAERFDRLYGTRLAPLPRDDSQRPACGCIRSTDIGSYDQTCPHRCVYCYAARDR